MVLIMEPKTHPSISYEIDPISGRISTTDPDAAIEISARINLARGKAPPSSRGNGSVPGARRRTHAAHTDGIDAGGLSQFAPDMRRLLEMIGQRRQVTLDDLHRDAQLGNHLRGIFGALAKKLIAAGVKPGAVYTRTKHGRTVTYDAGPTLLKWIEDAKKTK